MGTIRKLSPKKVFDNLQLSIYHLIYNILTFGAVSKHNFLTFCKQTITDKERERDRERDMFINKLNYIGNDLALK